MTALIRFCCFATVVLTAATPYAADLTPQVSQRFAKDTSEAEVPDFQRHVDPLLGKLGCNGRACHGSFQGQGGFRLSLFGYDFQMDHEGLSERIDTDDPAASYALQKATLTEPHRGGKRMDIGSWQYRVLLNWIKGGARVGESPQTLERVEVTPKEVVFSRSGEAVQLRAVAVWEDGSREDVTPLCRFNANNDQVAKVTREGLLTAAEPGDTHVIVSYDVAVVPVPVMRPVSDRVGDAYPFVAAPTRVDEHVVSKLQKLGIVQSETCSDSDFLRRVSLDMTGSLPTADEVRRFLADTRSDKRSRKIEELLERPGYAAWWTQKLCDFTGNSEDQLNNVTPDRKDAPQDWYDWIYDRVERNVPYDEIVEGIVMATSRNAGESYTEFCKNVNAIYASKGDRTFAERESLPHYWARQNFRTKEDRAIGFAYTFLGTRIQCAQCHKHPFDQWTQDDFREFTSFFVSTVAGRNNQVSPDSKDEYQKMMESLDLDENLKGGDLRKKLLALAKEGKAVPLPEVYARPIKKAKPSKGKGKNKRRNQNNRVPTTAKLLGGDVVDLTEYADPREPMMDWLRSNRNDRFARSFVNRVWAGYFNVGIVEPPDDMSLANPPSNAALLDYLADGFLANGYDMKWLHRTIANSRTYQLSWKPNETNKDDERNFSRAVPRRLPAEVAYDAVVAATASDEKAETMLNDLDGRAISMAGAGRRVNNRGDLGYAMRVFGRSIRESNCDCDRSEEASLLQTVFLRNDRLTLTLIDDPKTSWLAQVARDGGVDFRPQVSGPDPKKRRKMQQEAANRNRLAARARQLRTQIRSMTAQLERIKKNGKPKQVRSVKTRLGQLRDQLSKVDKSRKPVEPETVAKIDTNQLIEDIYLRTLSRLPNDDETRIALSFMAQSKNEPIQGARDLMWALLNTKEFIVNH